MRPKKAILTAATSFLFLMPSMAQSQQVASIEIDYKYQLTQGGLGGSSATVCTTQEIFTFRGDRVFFENRYISCNGAPPDRNTGVGVVMPLNGSATQRIKCKTKRIGSDKAIETCDDGSRVSKDWRPRLLNERTVSFKFKTKLTRTRFSASYIAITSGRFWNENLEVWIPVDDMKMERDYVIRIDGRQCTLRRATIRTSTEKSSKKRILGQNCRLTLR